MRTLGALVTTLTLLALGGVAEARSALTYTRGSANPTVWLANANGKQARRLGPGAQPLVAPSGSAVAATAIGSKGAALSVYRPGSSTSRYFNLSKVNAVALAWSPDSRYLAVELDGVSTRGKGSGLAVIDTKTNRVTTIATGSACISRNGKTVLVDFGGFEQAPSRAKVATVPFGGGHATVLVRHAGEPSWNR